MSTFQIPVQAPTPARTNPSVQPGTFLALAALSVSKQNSRFVVVATHQEGCDSDHGLC